MAHGAAARGPGTRTASRARRPRRRGAAAPLLAALSLAALAQLLPAAGVAAYAISPWRECHSQSSYGGVYGMEAVANLTAFRSRLLSKMFSSFDPSATFAQGHKRYDPYDAFITCPPGQDLIRYGREADGGKLLCDVSRLRPPCVIYSLGSAGDYSFESDMVNVTQCEIHTFDCTYDGKSIHERHKYHKLCVGQGGEGFRTWQQITENLDHGIIDIAKIDIEGHEPAVLAELRHDVPLPRQIVMEMHFRHLVDEPTVVALPAPRFPGQMALLFMHLTGLGYGITGREDNIWGEPGCCSEFSFLHVERLRPGLDGGVGRRAAAAAAAARNKRARSASWIGGLLGPGGGGGGAGD